MDRREILGGEIPSADERCAQVRPLLSLYVDRMASPEEISSIDLHLAGCSDCRSAYEWMVTTHEILASRPCAIPPPDMSLRIRAAIAASRDAEARQAVRFRTVYRPAFALAASAVIAAVAFGIVYRGAGHGNGSGRNSMVAVRPEPPAVSSRPVTPPAPAAHPGNNVVAAVPLTAIPKVKRPEAARHTPPVSVMARVPSEAVDTAAPSTRVMPENAARSMAPHSVPKTHALTLEARIPRTTSHRLPSPIRHSDTLVAIIPVRHPATTVASSRVPDQPVPERGAPAAVAAQPEPVHPTLVAAQPELPAARSNSLLADVQGHVSSMSRQRTFNDSFRVSRSDGGAHLTSYETPTDFGNHAEAISGTAPITH